VASDEDSDGEETDGESDNGWSAFSDWSSGLGARRHSIPAGDLAMVTPTCPFSDHEAFVATTRYSGDSVVGASRR
jgi:hypothetical protein